MLAGEHMKQHDIALLEKIKDSFPDKLEYFTQRVKEQADTVAKNGQFISNDCDTPETPDWCPVRNNTTMDDAAGRVEE